MFHDAFRDVQTIRNFYEHPTWTTSTAVAPKGDISIQWEYDTIAARARLNGKCPKEKI